ncbi:MAG: hypothetical protein C0483_19105 [Pirellula sp.]|nr:hypothetical protein [Pirellula sp.]
MATVATPYSFASQPWLARRADLKIRPAPTAAAAWLVEDPAASRYFELSADEYFLLRQFDGRSSPTDICTRYERAFAPRRLDDAQLDEFATRLYHQGLLVSTATGQGEVLRRRATETARTARRRALLNPLAIRLPGVDPAPILSRIAPACDWMFSRTFLLLAMLLAVAAVGIAVLRSDLLLRELRAATAAFHPSMLLSLALVTAGAKVIHELAHAVACRKLGGNCREIGVLLLVGVPCLYCDVTSVWMIPERWKRAVVGAAGIFAELFLAAVAILLWNASAPGLFHDVCLQLVVVCSVATVLFNGNPLLRYDGYFILTDLVGTSNLGERSETVLGTLLRQCYCGDSENAEIGPLPARPWLWAGYAFASIIYRTALTVLVWWFLRTALRPLGLTVVADAVLALSLVGMVVIPLRRTTSAIRQGLLNGRIDGRRLGVRSLATSLLLAGALLWPWPHRVAAPAVAHVREGRHLFIATPGKIVSSKQLGDVVDAGESVATLVNLDIEREASQARSEAAQRHAAVDHLESRRVDDPAAGDELPAARQAAAAADDRVRLSQKELARLVIRSPVAGTVLPLPQALANLGEDPQRNSANELDSSPLAPRNHGRYLAAGTPLCTVGDAQKREAVLVVDERDVEFVQTDADVRCQFDATGTRIWHGRVIESTAMRDTNIPPEVAAAGHLALEAAPGGSRRPTAEYFLVRVAIEDDAGLIPIGAVGQARIDAGGQSLAARGMRFLSETFRMQSPAR